MSCSRICCLCRRLLPVLLAAIVALWITADLSAANVTQTENAKPGSPDWQLTNPATNHEIEGYASLNSVNRGNQISFFVNTADPTFTLEVFRMGWYGGAGARRMMSPVQLAGTKQSIPSPDPIYGMVECQWTNPYVLAIPFSPDQTNWASGIYLVRLTGNTSGKQSFIIFIVRDDARSSKYLYQLSTNTFQAYNNWGGKSLYPWNSTGSLAAVNVSFNRPYAMGNQATAASGVGAGEFLTNLQPASEGPPGGWGYNMVRFLEREGYDVSYIADVDAHENGNLLLSHKALLVVGHSEYWSWQMRTNVQAARDANVGIGFFSSNTCYWQIRFAASSISGAPDRTIIGYKNVTIDPYASNPATAYLTTGLWRSSPVNLPEEALVGVMYGIDQVSGDIVVTNPSHWVYTFTGLQNGAHLPGILGYEIDSMQGNQPANTVGVAHEVTASGIPADTTVYTAASGATVFAAGSFQWSWGLDDYNAPNIRPSVINPAVQQITRNVLARLAGDSFSPAFSIIPSPRIQTVSTGTSISYTLKTTAFGYSPTIALSLAGLPTNVPYTFTPATLGGSGSSVLTISPNGSSSSGTYLLAMSASDGTQTRTESVSLTISNMVPKTNWKLVYVDSQETQCENGAAVNGFDASTITIWHTQYCPSVAQLPHEMQIDMGTGYVLGGFLYLPRQDGGSNGRIGQYEFYATNDLSNWGAPLATGSFANDATEKQVLFASNIYRYIRLRALTEANGGAWTSMAELTALQSSPVAPAITSTSNTTFAVGVAGSFAVTATGLPVPTLSETGTLPSGVTFNVTTGVLSGAPTAGTTGAYNISFKASNGVGADAVQNFTLTVSQGVSITSANNTTFAVGVAGSFTVTATGSPVPTLSETGTLPSGVTFTPATGKLAGTPAAGTAGSYPITFTAHNGVGTDAVQNFTLTVGQAPVFNTIRIKAGAAFTDSTGAAWSADTSSCTGGSSYSQTHGITGALPAASDQALYQAERYGNSTCTFTAPAGTYAVTIKFAENYWSASRKRLFSVSINGTTVLSTFDIFATAGGEYKALDRTFSITTSGSPITIKFINGSADDAKYDAIQIALM